MPHSQLIVGLLVEGAVGAVVLIAIAFLLSRFTRDIVNRSLLVIFLFAAAGAYFGFAIAAGAGPMGRLHWGSRAPDCAPPSPAFNERFHRWPASLAVRIASAPP